MSLRINETKRILFLTATIAALSACTNQGQAPSGTENASIPTYGSLAVNANLYRANKIVCDPLNGGQVTQKFYTNGIKAELYYRSTGMPIWSNAGAYVTNGTKSTQNIFLSDMNVPTRLFTEGFSTTQGQVLKDDQNNKLIEYFGLKMTTNIALTANDDEGDYEFASLADDGAVLKIKSGNSVTPDEVLIQNDGDHPTRMGCSNQTVRLTKNTMLPVEMTYYQGPRYHIANVLMFRKSATAGQDASCGLTGNETYFDYNHFSEPQQAFKNLLARGWKVLMPDNFRISVDGATYNPCVAGTAPGINGFQLGEIILSDVTFIWETNIPATSQIILTEVLTGAVTVTDSDNMLRLDHEVLVTGLKPKTQYKAQAVSLSADLGRSSSSEIYFTTQ